MRKLLIANRGEIAIRAARAARELGITSVAMYSAEDRSALHRLIADEAYQIGEAGHPVRTYLDIPAIIEIARQSGSDAVYPGYGFLSESAVFAQAVIDAGLTWVGPTPETLLLTGDKVRGRESATRAGVPVLGASDPVATLQEALAEADRIGYPVFIKASAGGGGRGLRRVDSAEQATLVYDAAKREAAAAFGDDTLFVEQAVVRPRHVEVQVLADSAGNVVHLYERDCSVQRRHQKVVEIAPAPGLPRELVERLCSDAVSFAREVRYAAAGTVEFLVWRDPDGRAPAHVAGYGYSFIEMNPRIQVEHTVTEEVTGIDLVLSQLRIARGETLADLGIAQEGISVQRSAIQCRLTTEDPSDDFRPATGTIVVYRSPGGPGVRLDGATYAGADVTPFYDSLLVKLTTSGADFTSAARRARRALSEFQVRGVATNVSFLRALLSDPDFLSGELTTAFLDEHPGLMSARPGATLGAASGLLLRLSEVTVNRPHGESRTTVRDPAVLLPADVRPATVPQVTAKQVLDAEGPDALAAWLRGLDHVAITDTTLRDAHQSLLATRLRTRDLVIGARAQAALLPGLFSLECWGGATFDAALRFLGDDPWQRLEQLRAAAPGTLTQMLIRGRNALGYAPYPEDVVRAFVGEARQAGMDVFRVFDALNSVEKTRPVIDAVREHAGYAEGAICYTGDVLDPDETTYTLDYYLRVADQYVAAGAHGLVIKDMAGLLRPPAATALVTALRARFDVPVRLHTHDTAGGQLATYLAAIEAGVDGVDCASAPLASGGSQPSLGALLAALAHADRDPAAGGGLDLADAAVLEPYWNAVRDLYAPFEAGQRSPGDERLPPRGARRPAVEPARAGRRARRRQPVRRGARRLPRRERPAGPSGQGHAQQQGGGRPRRVDGGRRRRQRRPAGRSVGARPARLGDRLPAGPARRPRGRLPRAVHEPGAGRQGSAGRSGVQLGGPCRAGRPGDATRGADPAHAPRGGSRVRGLARHVRRRVDAAHARLPVRAHRGQHGGHRHRRRPADVRRAGRHRRPRRVRPAQRPPARERPARRAEGRRRAGTPDRERATQGGGRQPRAPRRVGAGRDHGPGQGGRPGAGRRQGRRHRGHEDGVGRHRRHRRHGRYGSRAGQGAGGARRPRGRHDPGSARLTPTRSRGRRHA